MDKIKERIEKDTNYNVGKIVIKYMMSIIVA